MHVARCHSGADRANLNRWQKQWRGDNFLRGRWSTPQETRDAGLKTRATKSSKRDEGGLLALREGRAYDAKLCLG